MAKSRRRSPTPAHHPDLELGRRLVARFVRRAIEVGAGQMGFTNAALLGRIAEIAIVAFAVVIAINQIGIATEFVNILFIGIVGALALAFGLAFGLGGRDVAADLTRSWYDGSQATADRVRAQTDATSSRTMPSSRPAPNVAGREPAMRA